MNTRFILLSLKVFSQSYVHKLPHNKLPHTAPIKVQENEYVYAAKFKNVPRWRM